MRISWNLRDVLHNLRTIMSYAQHIAISHALCECVINLAGLPAAGAQVWKHSPNTSGGRGEGTWERWDALQQGGLLAALIQVMDRQS